MIDSADCVAPQCHPFPPCPLYPLPLTQAGIWLSKEAVVLACLLQCQCDGTSCFPALKDWLFIDCFVCRGWDESHTLSSIGSFGALQPTLISRQLVLHQGHHCWPAAMRLLTQSCFGMVLLLVLLCRACPAVGQRCTKCVQAPHRMVPF